MKNRFTEEEIEVIEEMTEAHYDALLEFIASIKRLRDCQNLKTAV